MIFDFKVYELKESSTLYDLIFKGVENPSNQFIVVGEDRAMNSLKVHQIDEGEIILVDGLKIDEFAMVVSKEDIQIKGDLGVEILEYDIPKQYLTLDIVEMIIILNSVLQGGECNMVDQCVMCSEPVPEGLQVCPKCMRKVDKSIGIGEVRRKEEFELLTAINSVKRVKPSLLCNEKYSSLMENMGKLKRGRRALPWKILWENSGVY